LINIVFGFSKYFMEFSFGSISEKITWLRWKKKWVDENIYFRALSWSFFLMIALIWLYFSSMIGVYLYIFFSFLFLAFIWTKEKKKLIMMKYQILKMFFGSIFFVIRYILWAILTIALKIIDTIGHIVFMILAFLIKKRTIQKTFFQFNYVDAFGKNIKKIKWKLVVY
jgi:hypothetical protein